MGVSKHQEALLARISKVNSDAKACSPVEHSRRLRQSQRVEFLSDSLASAVLVRQVVPILAVVGVAHPGKRIQDSNPVCSGWTLADSIRLTH